MKTARVQLYGITGKYVVVNTEATDGATVGSDLKWPDGSTVTEAQLRAASTPSGSSGSDISTSDDLDEGQYNLYFTQQRAQDAVGGILTDTPTIDFTYDGSAHVIKADLKTLANAGGGTLVKIARDTYGRVSGTSSSSTDDLLEGSANLYFTKARVRGSISPGTGITVTTDLSGNTVITLSSTLSGNDLTDWLDVDLTDWASVQLGDWMAGASSVTSFNGRNGDVDPATGDYNSLQVTMVLATLAALPSAAANQWKTIVVTDLTGGAEACLSDGTNWRRYSDRSIAS